MTDEERNKIFDLVKQAKEGKQYAFTQLYNKFKPIIYNTVYFIVKNKDAAEDITSTTFMKAFYRLSSYVDNISFVMWLKTIAVNSSIDYIRKTKKEKDNMFIDDEDSYIQLSSTADYSPEDNFIFKETDANITKALSNLKWKYRNAIELRISDNLSYKQLSEKLGISESQVRSLLCKAREKLKESLT